MLRKSKGMLSAPAGSPLPASFGQFLFFPHQDRRIHRKRSLRRNPGSRQAE